MDCEIEIENLNIKLNDVNGTRLVKDIFLKFIGVEHWEL